MAAGRGRVIYPPGATLQDLCPGSDERSWTSGLAAPKGTPAGQSAGCATPALSAGRQLGCRRRDTGLGLSMATGQTPGRLGPR